jgi:hypothetical protein
MTGQGKRVTFSPRRNDWAREAGEKISLVLVAGLLALDDILAQSVP